MNEQTQIKNNLFLLTFKPNTITMKPKKSRTINNIPYMDKKMKKKKNMKLMISILVI